MNVPFHHAGQGHFLRMWVVYERPFDFPSGFVGRLWRGEVATEEVVTAPTLEDVRALIRARFPEGAPLARFPDDDPVIVEVWL